MTIADLLEHLNIQYMRTGHHHCRPGWLQLNCPFCDDGSHKYHLGINESHGYANCWQCGAHSLPDTLSTITHLPIQKIYPLLKKIQHKRGVPDTPQTGRLRIPKGVGKMQRAHREYLLSRGYRPHQVKNLWGVQGIGIAPRLSWRLFIPITYHYQTVSWTTRAIGDAGSRYVSASRNEESISHKELLYGEDLAGHSIIIVEGPFDVWRIGPGAVATFGLNYSFAQVLRMKNHPIRTVCFDNTPEAQKRAKQLAKTLSMFPGDTYLAHLHAKDADVADEDEIQMLRQRFL